MVVDPNFIGFDKYQRRGAYHWAELKAGGDYLAKVEEVLRHVTSSMTCLDLGCGDGAYAGMLARRCRRVVGIDAEPIAVEHGVAELKKHGISNCELHEMSLRQVLDDGWKKLNGGKPFDLVYSMDVLEHLPDAEELLYTAVRTCAPGGLIVIGTPIFIAPELVSGYHVREYSIQALNKLVLPYLSQTEVAILPSRRKDHRVYDEGYYVVVGRGRTYRAEVRRAIHSWIQCLFRGRHRRQQVVVQHPGKTAQAA